MQSDHSHHTNLVPLNMHGPKIQGSNQLGLEIQKLMLNTTSQVLLFKKKKLFEKHYQSGHAP